MAPAPAAAVADGSVDASNTDTTTTASPSAANAETTAKDASPHNNEAASPVDAAAYATPPTSPPLPFATASSSTEPGQNPSTNLSTKEDLTTSPEGSRPDSTAKAEAPVVATAPPSLNYTMKGRKRWASIFWALVLLDSIAMPLVLYFALWYETKLSHNAVFSISTAALGGVSIVEYFLRFYRLWKKGSKCRVIGARRWYLDWFHWNYSIAWIFIMVELIVGTIPTEPPIRLLAMPLASLCYWFGFQLLVQDIARYFDYRTPIRISSVPAGDPFRPGIYSIVEDILAVDGSGGTEFRTALDTRFRASHDFRQMLHRLTAYWGIGAMGVAVLTTVLVFTIGRDAAYVVGWTVPFLWAGIFAGGTTLYVKRCLKIERLHWARNGKSEA